MGLNPHLITTTVTTAGTAAQGTATPTYVVSVYVEADQSNAGNIFVGDSSVSSTTYTTMLAAKAGFGMSTDAQGKPGSSAGGGEIALHSLWFDTSHSGDKVHITYFYRVDMA